MAIAPLSPRGAEDGASVSAAPSRTAGWPGPWGEGLSSGIDQASVGCDVIDGALDDLLAVAVRTDGSARGEVSGSALRDVVEGLQRLSNRVQALQDKAVAVAEQSRVADRTGAKDAGAWVARTLRLDPRKAAAQARRAEAVGHAVPLTPVGGASLQGGLALVAEGVAGEGAVDGRGADGVAAPQPGGRVAEDVDLGPRRSLTAQAQLAGDLSPEQVDIITRALSDLPGWVTPEQRGDCERELLRLASSRSPRDLRVAARRVIEQVTDDDEAVDAHEDALVAAEEDQAWERADFWMKDNQDGTWFGQFTVPTTAGLALKKILDAMTAPRRRGSLAPTGSEVAPAGGAAAGGLAVGGRAAADSGAAVAGDGIDWAALSPKERMALRRSRHGQALATVLEHLPTDHLHDKTAATILITTRAGDLHGELSRVGVADSGDRLSAGEVRRLACGAGLLPTVLDGDSTPLDLGRQTRCFTATQRAALSLTYQTCAVDGCDIPFAWTETHHLHAWDDGGATDLDNAVPLCPRHHRLLDRGYDHHAKRVDAAEGIERVDGARGKRGAPKGAPPEAPPPGSARPRLPDDATPPSRSRRAARTRAIIYLTRR